MKVLITGRNGQLGWELQRTVPKEWQIIALKSKTLDITNPDAVQKTISKYAPGLIINASAYTAVDKAEKDKNTAFAVNANGAANLAKAAKKQGSRFIHVSTDFVFDGNKSQPYLLSDKPNPTSVYGASKLEGEQKVSAILQDSLIIRTAWVYSSHGNNFVKTMLNLMDKRKKLNIVVDQISTPTWANSLAEAIWKFTSKPELKGIYHYTDSGVASWYDFAVAIQEEALRFGILEKDIPLKPIRTQDYPTPAKRPSYSVLDKTDTWKALNHTAPHWRTNLRNMLKEFKR